MDILLITEQHIITDHGDIVRADFAQWLQSNDKLNWVLESGLPTERHGVTSLDDYMVYNNEYMADDILEYIKHVRMRNRPNIGAAFEKFKTIMQ